MKFIPRYNKVDLIYDCKNNQIKSIVVSDINVANSNSLTGDNYVVIYWQKDPTATYTVCK